MNYYKNEENQKEIPASFRQYATEEGLNGDKQRSVPRFVEEGIYNFFNYMTSILFNKKYISEQVSKPLEGEDFLNNKEISFEYNFIQLTLLYRNLIFLLKSPLFMHLSLTQKNILMRDLEQLYKEKEKDKKLDYESLMYSIVNFHHFWSSVIALIFLSLIMAKTLVSSLRHRRSYLKADEAETYLKNTSIEIHFINGLITIFTYITFYSPLKQGSNESSVEDVFKVNEPYFFNLPLKLGSLNSLSNYNFKESPWFKMKISWLKISFILITHGMPFQYKGKGIHAFFVKKSKKLACYLYKFIKQIKFKGKPILNDYIKYTVYGFFIFINENKETFPLYTSLVTLIQPFAFYYGIFLFFICQSCISHKNDLFTQGYFYSLERKYNSKPSGEYTRLKQVLYNLSPAQLAFLNPVLTALSKDALIKLYNTFKELNKSKELISIEELLYVIDFMKDDKKLLKIKKKK